MSSAIALSDRRHAEQIAVLRAELACAQAARGLVLSFGIAAVDGRLADGGLDSAGLHEIAAASATLSDDAAATLLAAGLAGRIASQSTFTLLRALPGFDLYAPGPGQDGPLRRDCRWEGVL